MVDRLLSSMNLPHMFQQTLFSDFDPRRENGNQSILRQIEEWNPTEKRPALFLQGPPDRGKTMLASALLNEYHAGYTLPKNTPKAAAMVIRQERCPVYFIPLAELIALHLRLFQLQRDVERGIREPSEYLELDQLLQDLRTRVKVLVIDDVGKEHRTGSGFAQDEFDLLVRARHNNGLVTCYTTNVPLRRWADQYSDSMRSLIERSSLVLTF